MAQESDKLAKELEVADTESTFVDKGTETETAQIKAQIVETRNNMGETIDAIQERLSYSNISEQVSEHVNNAIETAKDTVYDATIGKAVNFMKTTGNDIAATGAVRSIKDNPLPYALIGLGAGLLIYNNMGSKKRSAGFDTRGLTDRSGYSDAAYNAVSNKLGGAVDTVSSTAGKAVDTVSSAAGSAIDTVTGAASTTYGGARDLAAKAYDRAGELGHTAHETYDHYIEENPLAVGAVALAVGAAVGFAIPSTRYEGQLVGETRDNLLHKAESVATEFVGTAKEKVREVAAGAGSAISKEVEKATTELADGPTGSGGTSLSDKMGTPDRR
jgi:ElaB/YqjD/DUF883 family membrane-anchored ribosome-binding protein